MPQTKKRTYAPRSSSSKPTSKRPTYSSPVVGGVARINKRPSMGNRTKASFIYCEDRRSVTSLTNLVGGVRFALSSLFDPNVTDIGHQPVNFDQLMALYEEYIVYEVEYRIQCYADNFAGSQLHLVSVTDQDSESLDARVYIENGQTQWSLVNATAGSPAVSTFTGKVDIAKAHGITRDQLFGDTRYSGTSGTSPTENIFLICGMRTITGSTTTTASFTVELRFNAMLIGSKLNALS